MTLPSSLPTIGVLCSGGLDSCVLIADLLRQGHGVQPFYVRSGLLWEAAELAALRNFLRAVAGPRLAELIVLDMPLTDLYGAHWSVDGRGTPGAQSPDSAVYLPGRNALLAMKPALWCVMHGIGQLALAVLADNPFADATDEFFRSFEDALARATGSRVAILRPFAACEKSAVIRLGRDLPLGLTFSCIRPEFDGQSPLHCGRCNKCAERQRAFQLSGIEDPTVYINQTADSLGER